MGNKKDPELESQRKINLMLATFKLLAKMPDEKMTLADVAKETGISPGLVSYYFKNKENLIVETARFILNLRKESLFGLAAIEMAPKDRIKKFIEMALPSREEVEMIANFFIQLWAYGKKSPLVAKTFLDLIHEQQKFVEQLVTQFIEEGFTQKGDVKAKALLINALLDGLGIHVTWKVNWDIKKVHGLFYSVVTKILSKDL